MADLQARLATCGLEMHPTKTKIVYCKDNNRGGNYPNVSFDFLGYCFRPRRAENSRTKRIKSLCGAKPPQKLRWTNAGRWIAMGIMEILPRTLGGWADSRGSACASCVV
jgi:hypothetical protein